MRKAEPKELKDTHGGDGLGRRVRPLGSGDCDFDEFHAPDNMPPHFDIPAYGMSNLPA